MRIFKRLLQLSLLLFSITNLTAHAAPAAPILIGPIGMLNDQPPAFTWSEVESATWYRVWAKDESGVAVADWVKAINVCDGICTYAPDVGTEGTTVWKVRGYDGELGAWSARAMFFDQLSRPGLTTLLSPLLATSEPTPTFEWTLVPEATWYKIEIIDQFESIIASQWLRADSNNVDCDPNNNTCSKTPLAIIPGNFIWRVRTYNAAGLGPWTQYEFVSVFANNQLSANPNPLIVPACDTEEYEFMVSNESDLTITSIYLEQSFGDIIVDESESTSSIECEEVISVLEPGDSCVITRTAVGNSTQDATQTISISGLTGEFEENDLESIIPAQIILDIEIEVSPFESRCI